MYYVAVRAQVHPILYINIRVVNYVIYVPIECNYRII